MDDHGSTASEAHSEARTHAPTLLGGSQPGAQGEARVWAPNPWRLRFKVATDAGWVVLWTGSFLFARYIDVGLQRLDAASRQMGLPGQSKIVASPGWDWMDCGVAVFFLFSLWVAYQHLRRPRYLTTDDAGIGVTTRKGSRALNWGDIRLARFKRRSTITLKTDDETLKIAMPGYNGAVRRDLFALIVNRANLYRSPHNRGEFIPEARVRDRFLARNKKPKFERPPVPAPKRPGADRFTALTFAMSLLAVTSLSLSPIWVGIWAHINLFNIEVSQPPGTSRPKTDLPMWEILNHVRESANQAPEPAQSSNGFATVWINQRPGSNLASLSVPGCRALWIDAEWAPLLIKGLSPNLYRYEIKFTDWPQQRSDPGRMTALLRSGTRLQSISLRTSSNPPIKYVYSNRWWSLMDPRWTAVEPKPRGGGAVNAIPSPRDWRYVGISVFDKRPIAWVRFANAPVREYCKPADGSQPAAAVAAWLPGAFKGDRLSCDLIFRDGGVRHLVLSPGVKVKGVSVIWNMPPDLRNELPNGPI